MKHSTPSFFNQWAAVYYYRHYILLLMSMFIVIVGYWPGTLCPDSLMQYQQALSGHFTDHHPPAMAYIWRLLLPLIDGPAAIFLLHMAYLYVACLLFMRAYPNAACFYALFPLFPSLACYAGMIWKDVSFAFSFFAALSILTLWIQKKSLHSTPLFSLFSFSLIYGSCVKFQAIFTALPLIFGYSYVCTNFSWKPRTILISLGLYSFLWLSVYNINSILVPPEHKSHAWQYVKIYDIAGISLACQKNLFPKYIKQYPLFSMQRVQEQFNHERVDDLVFFNGSPIPFNANHIERKQLYTAWKKVILNHPWAYIQHRYANWHKIIFAKPFEKIDKINIENFNRLSWLKNLKNSSCSYKRSIYHAIMSALFTLRYLFSFFIVLCFAIAYIGLGCIHIRKQSGLILVLINGTALALVLALFPCCMASSLRYVYPALCWVHASHPIAWNILKKYY